MRKQEMKLTFNPKLRFKSHLLFKVPKYFDKIAAFIDGIPTEINTLQCDAPYYKVLFLNLQR